MNRSIRPSSGQVLRGEGCHQWTSVCFRDFATTSLSPLCVVTWCFWGAAPWISRSPDFILLSRDFTWRCWGNSVNTTIHGFSFFRFCCYHTSVNAFDLFILPLLQGWSCFLHSEINIENSRMPIRKSVNIATIYFVWTTYFIGKHLFGCELHSVGKQFLRLESDSSGWKHDSFCCKTFILHKKRKCWVGE